ncbi:histidine--tRNA ligase [Candidatus Woesearchaeota archaeon]|nr:histidine--tRNA ligase [Candidatus Woesearchaeota archaeon]
MAKLKARLESAQHILHHILTHEYNAKQCGMQFHENKIRIDVRCKTNLIDVPKEDFEKKINDVIKKNLPVIKTMYQRKDVPKDIDISMIPPHVKEVRIVEIKGFDIQPCGNPHVDNTSEIGEYRIIERKKKGKDTYRFVGEVVEEGTVPLSEKKTKEKFELQLAKGVRDFSPSEKIIRDKILNTIKEVFELYGYNPIELPVLERYETLAAKYAAGEDSDALKEIFITKDNGGRKLGLRFDLTVPFSRFVGMNPNLKIPFKKYVTGPVFRDGPIKTGRYREFVQIDPDIMGCKDVIADAEIITITEEVFSRLGFDCVIEFNTRKLINGILNDLKIPKNEQPSIIISIDKLKKIGKNGVELELKEKGLTNNKIQMLFKFFKDYKTNEETLNNLKKIVKSKIGKEGVQEIKNIIKYIKEFGVKSAVFRPSLARGLAYYTGPVYEAFLKGTSISSSAAGGGRYDEIIGKFIGSKKNVPATGISFGIEVIVEAIKEKEKLKQKSITQVYIIPIKTLIKSIGIAQKLRKAGIKTDMDIMQRGISKNLQYANAYGIPFVLFIGEDELKQNKVKLKDMKSGKEELLSVDQVIDKLK